MKLTAEDYKRHYRELSDAELLAIDRDDLVDVARRCYDTEMTRRQITPEPQPEHASPAAATEADSGEDLVQVAMLTDLDTAMYLQKILRDADIPADLVSEPTASSAYARGSVGLRVPVDCAESARELIGGTLGQDNKILVRRWFEKDWTPAGMDLNEFSVTIDDLLGEEDKVAVRFTVEGANPRTGRDVKFGGIAIVRVADGKIAETWIKLDT